MRRWIAALALCLPLAAWAQAWPKAKPITLIVPFTPGGNVDFAARLFATRLQQTLKQSVVVENRPGAGGAIGARAVATAPPDGYTLLIGNTATLAVIPAVARSPGYDAAKDFTAVGKLIDAEQILVVSPKLPVFTVPALIDYAKEHPGKLSFASGGVGNLTHLSGELFKLQAGIDIVHVPYKSDAESATAVVSGHVQMSFSNTALMQPLIREGKLRALGLTSIARLAEAPEIPPIADTLPGFNALNWTIVLAPADTPKEIVSRLNAALKAAMATAVVQEQIGRIGMLAYDSPPPTELPAFVGAEVARWSKIVQQAGIAGAH